MGRAIARGLAESGADVVITSRDLEKGKEAAAEIASRAGAGKVRAMAVDLGSFESIRRFVKEYRDGAAALHVLSNNAAVLPMKRRETADGVESIFGVNYLGHFLLTALMADLLLKSAPARVITVSGDPLVLRRGRIDFEDIESRKRYNPFSATLQAAFARVVFTLELARRMENTGVTANTFHPGLVRSSLARDLPRILKPLVALFELFLGEDSPTGVYLAVSPEAERYTGRFFKNSRPVKFEPAGYDEEVGKRLWSLSEEMNGTGFDAAGA